MSMAAVTLEADGIKVDAWAESKTSDIHIKIDDKQEIILSPRTAMCLALALIEMASGEEE